jgi:4-hydroxysphinganine ceramide fatty acyl 2-hydroxylase
MMVLGTLGWLLHPTSAIVIVGWMLAGVVGWTLFEYWMHRAFFHWKPKNPILKAWVERIHIHHHLRPNDYKILNAGPAFALPQAMVSFLVLSMGLGLGRAAWLMMGILIGYFLYECMHYTAHAHTGGKGWVGWLRKYHRLHHHADWESRFGVTTPFWDWVFQTQGKKPAERPPTI